MKKIKFLLPFLMAISFSSSAQILSPDNGEPQVFHVVEIQPAFAGGEKAKQDFIFRNMKYPRKAIRKKEEGTVFIKAVVAVDGTLQNAEIETGKQLKYGLPEEALRIVKNMPPWIPGKQNGVVQRYLVHIPVRFNIEKYKEKNSSKKKSS